LNPARPPPGTALCRLEELAVPGSKGFRFREGEAMFNGFVVRKDGVVSGYVDSCPHAGWPLAMWDRYLTAEGDLIICRAHGAMFEPGTGACVSGPAWPRGLDPWPVVVEDGVVVTG
jgi:nitrite reductase/ring-hydroxylating ferredoxin subunit